MKSLAELKELQANIIKTQDLDFDNQERTRVVIGLATCGMAAGATPLMNEFNRQLENQGMTNVDVVRTGCIGMCKLEPIVEVYAPGEEKVTYIRMTPEKVERIVREHLLGKKPVMDYVVGSDEERNKELTTVNKTDFYKNQRRIALRNCGVIDPESIDEYIAFDGYRALGKALTEMTQDEVIDTVMKSGLRGRGGGGFPTARKWMFTKNAEGEQKYVVCNADEGDPGAFMDRSVLEGDPHCLIEAMTICGYAVGANHGYIYVRAEYPVAVKRLEIAIAAAREKNLLGKNIFGTDFSFDIDLRLGAGAFVCGEETALMQSIEGHRGEPVPRPPFPAIKGLFGKPTTENNVETFANIPQIVLKGADWFASYGTEKSKGTKVFALGGKITNTGLVEIPMGTTLREVIENIGGGIPNGKKFKAAQTGGPSGGCIPASLMDVEIDYDNLIDIGSMMGSGGLIVMDEDNCMVDMAKFFLDFTVDESCGKCVPCRTGTKRLYELLTKITSGKGEEGDLDRIEQLCYQIKESSLCGLGQTAPNPVLSMMKYFREEYEAHINDKSCPAGVCKNLLNYKIIADKCIGCTACAKVCPTNAITGNLKEPHVIDTRKCIKCGACIEKCKFGAIERG